MSVCECVCSPFPWIRYVCVSECDGATGWKSFMLARVRRAAVNRSADVARSFCLVPVKGGDPFSCVHPTSINSLGKEALEEEEREDKCRESASRRLFFS